MPLIYLKKLRYYIYVYIRNVYRTYRRFSGAGIAGLIVDSFAISWLKKTLPLPVNLAQAYWVPHCQICCQSYAERNPRRWLHFLTFFTFLKREASRRGFGADVRISIYNKKLKRPCHPYYHRNWLLFCHQIFASWRSNLMEFLVIYIDEELNSIFIVVCSKPRGGARTQFGKYSEVLLLSTCRKLNEVRNLLVATY